MDAAEVCPILKFDCGRTCRRRTGGWAGFLSSVGIHAILLIAAGASLVKPVEFAVDAGFSGVEIELIAGAEPQTAVSPPQPEPAPVIPEPVPVVQESAPVISQPIKEEIKPAAVPEPRKEPLREISKTPASTAVRSVKAGNAPIDAAAGSGARTQALPSYLSNPAPRYPADARRNGWEGVVLLKVSVGKNGTPRLVEVKRTSGHESLDASAVKAVKAWRFRPAKIGDVPIETSVEIPVRFSLEKN